MIKKINNRQQKQKEILLSSLKKTPIVQLVCEKTGISRATYYRWQKEDKDFRKSTNTALLEGKSLMNDMAESQLLSAIKDRNMTAIIFWLKHHHSDYATRVKLSGSITTKDEPLSEEQEQLLKHALSFVSLNSQQNE